MKSKTQLLKENKQKATVLFFVWDTYSVWFLAAYEIKCVTNLLLEFPSHAAFCRRYAYYWKQSVDQKHYCRVVFANVTSNRLEA